MGGFGGLEIIRKYDLTDNNSPRMNSFLSISSWKAIYMFEICLFAENLGSTKYRFWIRGKYEEGLNPIRTYIYIYNFVPPGFESYETWYFGLFHIFQGRLYGINRKPTNKSHPFIKLPVSEPPDLLTRTFFDIKIIINQNPTNANLKSWPHRLVIKFT